MFKFETTSNLTENFLSKKYPEYYSEMIKFVKEENISLSEKIWLFQNNLQEKPLCGNCQNKTKFIKFSEGYYKFCSRKCSAIHSHKNKEVKDKRISKMLEYNLDKEKKLLMTEKANLTKSTFSEEKKNQINSTRKETNLKKYGVESISQLESVKDIIKHKLSVILPKIRDEKTKERIEKNECKFLEGNSKEITIFCNKCQKTSTNNRSLINQRIRYRVEICTNCNPIGGSSDFQRSVKEFIKSNIQNEIFDSYRQFKSYEIDIFIPDLKLGFECNGLWWHSEIYRDKNYHKNKIDFFKSKGIEIVHIWEDDWKFKKEIVKSRILSKLGILPEKIYARNCQIKYVKNKELKVFLNQNHIQGWCVSKINIGLFYNNEIVSVGTFGHLRKNLGQKSINDNFELLRFCNKNNINIPGSFSKIMSHFIKEIKPTKLISYCDMSYNSGKSYLLQGFTLQKETAPNYWYFHKDIGVRINRWNFRKDKLIKEGFDENLTEIEIMKNRGYYRLFDCGSFLFSKEFNEERETQLLDI
jgi:hypothetical protein